MFQSPNEGGSLLAAEKKKLRAHCYANLNINTRLNVALLKSRVKNVVIKRNI